MDLSMLLDYPSPLASIPVVKEMNMMNMHVSVLRAQTHTHPAVLVLRAFRAASN